MEKALLAGPFIGELGWHILRFAPYVIWQKQNHYKDSKLIVLCREDSFDLYGTHADILVPMRIEGDCTKYTGDCFRLIHYPESEYHSLAKKFKQKYKTRFSISAQLYPKIDKRNFYQKNQYPQNQLLPDFRPRQQNFDLISQYIPKNKPWVVISPRFRKGYKRNWKHWLELYDMIESSGLMNRFEFILIGKAPEYTPDPKKRFFDINQIPIGDESSLIGLTIAIVKQSILTVGSQSAIPNLSLQLKTEVLEWGNQRTLHTKTYNYTNTKITFLDDMNFDIPPKRVFDQMKNILNTKKVNK